MTRNERKNRRLVMVILLSIIFLFLTNLIWLYAWTEYDYQSFEATSDKGNANVIGNDGDIYNGYGEVTEENEEE